MQMFALTLLPLLLSSVVTAVERRAGLADRCDISSAKISLPANQTLLVAPSQGPSYIGLAIGTQNYTCASNGVYTYAFIQPHSSQGGALIVVVALVLITVTSAP